MSRQRLLTLLLGGLASLLAAWLGLPTTPESPPAQALQGRVLAVADGDTLTVLAGTQEHRIRLAGIDAPELDQPHGQRARASLALLCLGRQAELAVQEQDRYGRSVADVRCQGMAVNAELVRRGDAWVYRAYATDPALDALEQHARAERQGLWTQARPTPPWTWRQQHQNK